MARRPLGCRLQDSAATIPRLRGRGGLLLMPENTPLTAPCFEMDPEYRTMVEAEANGGGLGELFMNRSPAHAEIVVEYLFRAALNRVCILSERLPHEVYGTSCVINAALGLFDRNPAAVLEVLVEE